MYRPQTYLFLDIIGEAILSGLEWIGNKIKDGIISAIEYLIGFIGYLISTAVCRLVQLIYSFFRVFSGLSTVTYKGEEDYLINVFFQQPSINKAYWGMALIGIALMFAFLIAAVIRKLFDVNEKQKASYGQILMGAGKSILIILLMSGIVTVSINVTNVLIQRISYLFDIASNGNQSPKKTFTPEEFAYMNDVFEIIGQYSLNPSYTSRYNINSCFNDIRDDLLFLQDSGVFEYNYEVRKEENGKQVIQQNWQLVLQKIAKTSNLKNNLSLDVYNQTVTDAILEAMNIIKANPEFRPLQTVYASYETVADPPLDVVIFLTGTGNAAHNSYYNEHAAITDPIRAPYYNGTRSIYSLSQVSDDFTIKLGGISYTIIIIIGALTIWQLLICVLTCATRIFNLMLLYIVAPPFAATIPLDDGQRFHQWVQAFVIQCVNVLGNIIMMRLVILYIPIILSSDLVLFENGFLNLVGKAVLIYAGITAAARGSDMISGILQGNGAGASAAAGNMNAAGTSAALALGGAAAGISGVSGLAGLVSRGWNEFKANGGIMRPDKQVKSFKEWKNGKPKDGNGGDGENADIKNLSGGDGDSDVFKNDNDYAAEASGEGGDTPSSASTGNESTDAQSSDSSATPSSSGSGGSTPSSSGSGGSGGGEASNPLMQSNIRTGERVASTPPQTKKPRQSAFVKTGTQIKNGVSVDTYKRVPVSQIKKDDQVFAYSDSIKGNVGSFELSRKEGTNSYSIGADKMSDLDLYGKLGKDIHFGDDAKITSATRS